MKFTRFLNQSLIAGALQLNHDMLYWLRTADPDSEISFLGSLILLALHYEGAASAIGPTRMANSFGYSRGRVSQEISKLADLGFVKRTIPSWSGRNVALTLTAAGRTRAAELVKVFSRLQKIVDVELGEKLAEEMNLKIQKLAKRLRSREKAQ